jgi:hypothetical protein
MHQRHLQIERAPEENSGSMGLIVMHEAAIAREILQVSAADKDRQT